MPERSTANLIVYRDGRERVSAVVLLRQLGAALANLRSESTDEAWLSALLRAGELECALCDAGSQNARLAAAISDELARVVCRANRVSSSGSASHETAQQLLASISDEGELIVSRPEGFAYYALHPLDFADLIHAAGFKTSHVHVVGIRSIGTTLSAIVAAKLNASGTSASRTTVRPAGHPYDRRTTFTGLQRNVIRQALARDVLFLVCDEGPGRSGSSLLSVAEALEQQGASCDQVILLCSHQPQVEELCAPRGAERWRRYGSIAPGMTKRLPAEAGRYLGGGEWREFFIGHEDAWPAAWPHVERLKFLSRDQQKLLKFEGYGPYGEQVRQREQLLAASGFGAAHLGHESGFGIQELIGGNQPGVAEVSPALLRHMAKYCAWRAAAIPATVSEHGLRQLEHMAAANVEQEFGFAPELRLDVERPAVCDGRMQHYEWRNVGYERWIKLDASTHGDDHFFPGPTDIAWDLAGICVEWRLTAAVPRFLSRRIPAPLRRQSRAAPASV